MNTTATHTTDNLRRQLEGMTARQICAAYLRAEYADTVTDELINDVIDNDLTQEQIDAIVGSVQDQPHLISR